MSKKTRAELISAIAMLLVAAIAMTSASFAWFTLSTAPEVAVEVQMGTTANLEIARASSGAWLSSGTTVGDSTLITEVTSNDALRLGDDLREFAWGSRVSNFEGAEGINFPVVPTTGSFNYAYPYYGEDGRTEGLKNGFLAGAMQAGDAVMGVRPYTTDIYTVTSASTSTREKTVAVGYMVWLRSNQDVEDLTMTAISEGTHFLEWVPTGTAVDGVAIGEATWASIHKDNSASYTAIKTNMADMSSDVNFTVRVHATTGAIASPTVIDDEEFVVPKLNANEPLLVEVLVTVGGEHVFARHLTEDQQLKITGFSMQFKSDSVKTTEGITD